jgi:hypothetical protein
MQETQAAGRSRTIPAFLRQPLILADPPAAAYPPGVCFVQRKVSCWLCCLLCLLLRGELLRHLDSGGFRVGFRGPEECATRFAAAQLRLFETSNPFRSICLYRTRSF